MTKTSKLIKKSRDHIKHGLEQCTHGERVMFVRMYGPHEQFEDDFLFNVDKIAEFHVDNVVDKMPVNKLEWAKVQVERAVQKRRNEI